MKNTWSRLLVPLFLFTSACATTAPASRAPEACAGPERPFGTLREQATRQQAWLRERMDTGAAGADAPVRHRDVGGADARVQRGPGVPGAGVAHHVRGAAAHHLRLPRPGRGEGRGAARAGRRDAGRRVRGAARADCRWTEAASPRQAELWGPDQWKVLKAVLEERQPKVIGINVSRTFAFADGLTHGEYEGMTEALGPEWTARIKPSGGLPVDLIAWRSADEERFYEDLTKLAWNIIETGFSGQVIKPGQDAHERRGVVDAPAGERPGAGDVVPAVGERAAAGEDGGGAGRGPHHRAGRRAALRLRGDGAAAEHGHAAHGLRAARGRDGRARGAEGGAGALQPAAGHRLRGAASGAHGQRDSQGLARSG